MEIRACVIMTAPSGAAIPPAVIRLAAHYAPVRIFLRDTQGNAGQPLLTYDERVRVVSLSKKASAFPAEALSHIAENGFTHALSVEVGDALRPEIIPYLLEQSRRTPDDCVLGTVSRPSQATRLRAGIRALRLRLQKGIRLGVAPTHAYCYPLTGVGQKISQFCLSHHDLMVRTAWSDIAIRPIEIPGNIARAQATTMPARRPWRARLLALHVHCKLLGVAACMPAVLRGIMVHGELDELPLRRRVTVALQHIFLENIDTPRHFALSVWLGLFCGLAPIWGYQMIAAAVLAHKLRLNKAITLAASCVSFPLIIPFIMLGSLVLGNYMLTGTVLHLTLANVREQASFYFFAWVLGSLTVAIVVSLTGALAAYALAASVIRRRRSTPIANGEMH